MKTMFLVFLEIYLLKGFEVDCDLLSAVHLSVTV